MINPDNWLGDDNQPLSGFSWSSGTDRNTTGLLLWSDVFLYDAPNGEKIAIYLMDTQGLFDNQTTTADNSKIFSLSTLISSVQILNLFNIFHEDQLQYLQIATEFARYASESKTNLKSFQNLLILIRDWNDPDDHSFGFNGGKQYLKNFLEIKDDQEPELKSVRSYLRSAFESINCFLMPHPGKSVARDSKYDGKWVDIDEEFLESMKQLFPALLGPNKLQTKIINSNAINPAELLVFIKTYIEQFTSGEMPSTKSIYESTLDKQFQILMAKSVDIYIEFIKNKQTGLNNENDINDLHEDAKLKALSVFGAENKFGTDSEGAEFKTKLENKIEDIFEQWKSIAIDNFKKLAETKAKLERQLYERELAQKRMNLATAESDEAILKTEDANNELKKAQQHSEVLGKEIDVLKLKLEKAEKARVAVIAEEKRKSAIDSAQMKAKFEVAIRNIEVDLERSQANFQQALRNAEMFRLKTIEDDTAQAKAVAVQQQTLILLEQMNQIAALNKTAFEKDRALANDNVTTILQAEQERSGFVGVLIDIIVTANTVVKVLKWLDFV